MRLGQKVFAGGGETSFLFSTAIKNAVNGTSMLLDWNSKTFSNRMLEKLEGSSETQQLQN